MTELINTRMAPAAERGFEAEQRLLLAAHRRKLAAADPVDLRNLEPSRGQLVIRSNPKAMLQRMMAAFRANY